MSLFIDSDEELKDRISNYAEDVNKRKEKMKAEDNKRADLDDQLGASRKKQKDLTTMKGRLEAEAKVRALS